MEASQAAGDAQALLWNGAAGQAWVQAQATLDGIFAPFAELLVEAVDRSDARRVLDVGCGTGGTTLAIARRLGAGGRCAGVDISAPMIAAARLRAEREGVPADFVCADAQAHAFAPGSVDAIVSRFGVMFFGDPVAAFANLRRAAAPGARLHCIAWRSATENPFMTAAERAAAPLLPGLPARRADAPGQFAFADPQRVRHVLERGGWRDVHVRALDVACALPEAGLRDYLRLLGPVGLALRQADERTRSRVVETVRAAFAPYVHGAQVRFDAACWWIGAHAPDVA
ncbi:class I SAM-dependent methyltransferase [Xanthomonas sp. AmX2]|uniref:class I SAM-dependent methyltransferase n=1 Tax=Xanthomonas sp. TaxID=29446 RepID=UPI001982156B|nr:class I SAM-dependent methyltransferase [Xanthomonas sp.]MBN6151770.1 class I SAM-dependent methyltransferase [Xanthomonas sp.]